MQQIALLGLGAMGSGMAANWLAKGFGLSVWNRTPTKAAPLAAKGARVAATPRAAAEGADIVVAMVADDEASRAVWLGDDGALAGGKPGAIAIEMSTVSPDWARALAGKAREHGLGFLDSPVGGSKGAAAAGELILFIGGDADTFEAARPALEAISARSLRLGPTGAGATWKLINNMLVGIQIAAFAEALALAEKAGFDRAQIAGIIGGSGTASPLVKMKVERMSGLSFEDPDFALRHMAKDLRYVMALAAAHGMTPEIAAAAADTFRRGVAAGHGDRDFAAVLAVLRE